MKHLQTSVSRMGRLVPLEKDGYIILCFTDIRIPVSSRFRGYAKYTMYVVQRDKSLSEEVGRVFRTMNQHISLNIVITCDEDCVLEILRQVPTF